MNEELKQKVGLGISIMDDLKSMDRDIRKELEEESEETQWIFKTMKKKEIDKLLSTGFSLDDIKKLLNGIFRMFDVVIEDMGEKVYAEKKDIILEMLHSVHKGTSDNIYKKMRKEMNSGITLKEFYEKKFPKYEKDIKNSYKESTYDEKSSKSYDIVCKVIIGALAISDIQNDK